MLSSWKRSSNAIQKHNFREPVLLLSELTTKSFGYFDPENISSANENKWFLGWLRGISAKKEAVSETYPIYRLDHIRCSKPIKAWPAAPGQFARDECGFLRKMEVLLIKIQLVRPSFADEYVDGKYVDTYASYFSVDTECTLLSVVYSEGFINTVE